MYADLIFGNTASSKAAQCGQVIDAYSTMVTDAVAGPNAMSGRDCGFATSEAACAMTSVISRSGETPAKPASPASDKAAVKARRVMNKGLLPEKGARAQKTSAMVLCASLKRGLWQWRAVKSHALGNLNFV